MAAYVKMKNASQMSTTQYSFQNFIVISVHFENAKFIYIMQYIMIQEL